MAQSFHLRALRLAARQLGGEAQLGSYLMVSDTDLHRWLRGEEPAPQSVMVRVIEFLAEKEAATSGVPVTQATRQKHNLV